MTVKSFSSKKHDSKIPPYSNFFDVRRNFVKMLKIYSRPVTKVLFIKITGQINMSYVWHRQVINDIPKWRAVINEWYKSRGRSFLYNLNLVRIVRITALTDQNEFLFYILVRNSCTHFLIVIQLEIGPRGFKWKIRWLQHSWLQFHLLRKHSYLSWIYIWLYYELNQV